MAFQQFSRPIWLFFDLDDTLWDFNKNSKESLRHIFYFFKEINSLWESFDEFLSEYHRHNDALWKDFADGKISSSALKTERWRRTLFPESDHLSPPPICKVIDTEYLNFLATQPHLSEGAFTVLGNLCKDYMLAILSNGFIDTQYRKLKYSGLWRFITRTVVSDEAGFQKPDTKLFDYARDATGATGIPVMIGDNPSTDILGALRAGWKAIWFNPGKKECPFSKDSLKEQDINPDLYLGSADDLASVELIIRSM